MVKLYLTFNFVFDRWGAPGLGSLWVVIQPHVVEAAAAAESKYTNLQTWIASSATSAASSFEGWCGGACPSSRVTPVPFPADARVSIVLSRPKPRPPGADTDEPPEIETRVVENDLRQGLEIVDPVLFANANVEPKRRGDPEAQPDLGVTPPSAVRAGLFPVVYNEQLREMCASTQEPERVAAALQLAFWGGSVKVLPKLAAKAESINANLFTTSEDGLALRTNLHAMLGLTFRLGSNDPADLAELSTFEALTIVVNGQPALNSRELIPFFSTLAALDPEVEERKVAVTAPDLGRRVYAREAFQELERIPGLPEKLALFRIAEQDRNPGGFTAPVAASWEQPTRVLVRAPAGGDPPKEQKWQPWRSLNGTLRRYRNTVVKDFAILEFVPEQRAEEFYASVQTVDTATAYLERAQVVVDSSVRRVQTTGEHDPGALTLVGAFWLPWDAHRDLAQTAGIPLKSRRTILFVGQPPANERVILMVPLTPAVGDELTLTLVEPPLDVAVGPQSDQQCLERELGALGRRWELRGSLPATEFDTLECLSDLPPGLKPSLCFPSLLDFSFAQSVGAVEVAVSASHDQILTVMQSASDAYREELVNFNALNLYVDSELQNPFSQVLPFSSDPTNERRLHHFAARVAQPVLPESFDVEPSVAPYLPARYRRSAPDVPAFFADLYSRMGNPRALEIRLEHTLGLELVRPPAVPPSAATFGDFRVALPTDVSLRLRGADGSEGLARPFVTLAYQGEETERLTFEFEVSWLAAPDAGDSQITKKEEVRLAAWRAVAELAHAESIWLEPRYCTFDFSKARLVGATGQQVLGDGLTWHKGLDWNVTAELQQRCRQWLNGQQLEDGTLTVSRPRVAISATALFLEWELLVTRTPERAPDTRVQWDIHWRPLPPWRIGRSSAVTEPTVERVLTSWLRDLKERSAVIAARRSDDEQERIMRAAALLSTKAKASSGWFGIGTCEDDDGHATATLCPVAFAPLARHPQLGDQTVDVVVRFLNLLSLQLLEPGWEVKDKTTNIRDLVVALADQIEPIDKLIEAALAGLTATPPAGDLALTAAQPTPGGPLHVSVLDAVRAWLWQNPGNYGAIKAFLVTLVRGGTLATPARVPAQLLALLSRREVTPQRTDAVSTSFFQAQEEGPDASYLRFVEPLDDARYDSAFTLPTEKGLNWKALEDELGTAFGQRCAIDRKLARRLPHEAAAEIWLPSRRSLTRPANVFCGYIEELQQERPMAPRVDSKLLEGSWIPSGSGRLALVGEASKIRRSDRPDLAVYSMLYWVVGDEELTEGFDHDEFFLQEVIETAAAQPDPVDSQEASPFLDMLKLDPSMRALEKLLAPSNLQTVSAALGNLAKDEPDTIPPAPTFVLQLQGDKVTVKRLPEGTEVAVFKPRGSQQQRGNDPARYLLLINTQVSVWKPVAYRFLQTRNSRRRFHRSFFQSALAGGQPLAYQRTAVRNDASAPPIDLGGRRSLSLAGLLDQTLRQRHFAGQPGPLWTDYDLSVTIRHHQRIRWKFAQEDGRRSEVGGLDSSHRASFPLLNLRHRGGTAATAVVEWFPKPYRDFLVDFQWSSATNLQFLRIENVRVTIS